MKKFLLTLIVTMLTCIGAWAQDDYDCVITLSPDPGESLTMELNATEDIYVSSVVWTNGGQQVYDDINTIYYSSAPDIVQCDNWGRIRLWAKAGGTATITVESTCHGHTKTKSFDVKVNDPSMATSIDASDVSVAYGYSEIIDVQLNPATATNFTSAVSSITGVTCTKVSDIVDGKFQLKVDASDVSAEATGTITITAGDATKTINLSVTEPTPLEYITLTPITDQTIVKGDHFDVTVTPYPTHAANKEIEWIHSDVITVEDNTVTGVKRGTTPLTAKPKDTRAEAKSINVTVTESFEGSVNVSTTSTRVGTTGGTYTLNLTNEDINESDYTVEYSAEGAAITVNSDGTFSPASEGTARVKAVVKPTTAGAAKGLTEGTVYSADINVGAEITATWNGSIANTELALGVQNTQAEDYPLPTWSETPAQNKTVYTVISDNESVVKGHFNLQGNDPKSLVLAGIKAGDANVSIKAEYYETVWNASLNKNEDILLATSTYGPVAVSVTPIDVKLTVSPSTDLTMDVTLTDGETRDLTTTVVDGFGVTKSASVTAGDDVVDLSINQEGTVLTIKPKAGAGVGTATVTVKAVWAKALDHPYVDKGTEEREVSFNVTVDDQTLVKTIDNPGTQDVQQGKTTVIPVAFTPTTAQFQAPTVSGSDKISVAYANGGADYTNLEVSVADDAEIGSTATVTLTPKAGSYVTDPVTFTVKVTKKELPVTDVKPQDVIHVGELCENMLGINESYGLEKDVDYTVSYVATGTNKNGQPLVSFDANGDIHGLHVGTAHITVTFAPIETSPKVSNYKAWTREMDITVVPGETELLLGVTQDVFEQGTGGSTTLNYSWSTKGYSGTPISDFTLGFDVEGTATGVTLGTADENLQKWDIIVGTDAPAEQFALVVTLVPNNPEDYNTATAKVGILVKNSSAQVTISVDENGVYTVNVPSPGAFGAISADPVAGGNAELVGDATLQGLKDAASVKVTGLIANSDVRELVHLIGESNSSDWTTAKVCTSLDMSGAQMTEEITSHDAGDNAPSNSWVDDGDYWSSRLFKLEYLSLPKPCPSYTTLPSNMYALYLLNPVSLNTLIIPEGWTEIKEQAFSDKAGNPTKSLTKLELPNSVEKIGAYAFSNLMVTVLNMPEKIQRIDEYAFAPCSKLEDVYFYGPAPSFVHTFAFGGDSQMCNNTVNDGLYNERYEPETTRFNYQVAGVLACLLHYPKEYQKDYIDMTRVYETCPVDQLYHKGNTENTYHVPGWTAAVINGILNHPDHNDVAQVHNRVDFGVKDKYYGYNMVWPSQSQMTMGFALSQAGYTWEGNALRTADQYNPSATYENGLVDKRGLYQFMTTMGNSTIHFTYEQDEWYTISLPFNMTPAEIQRIFGPQTQVCRFSKVVRETNEEAKEIRLEFRNSVMEDALTAETDYVGTHYDEYGDWDAENNWVVEPAFDKPGIIHHYPYMIKPSGTVNEDPAIKIDGTKRIFNGRGFERISGTLHHDAIVPVKSEGSYSFTYDFCPILEDGDIKPYSYVLVDNGPKKHEYVFYKGVKKDGAYVAGGKANQNTAYVQMPIEAEMVDGGDPEVTDWGYLDYITFFTSSSSSHAPINASVFGDDEVTGIEKVVIVCGTDKVADNKVYTINGQLVNGNVLAPGLYIKNGKKFIVK